jgi:hypothetical protein
MRSTKCKTACSIMIVSVDGGMALSCIHRKYYLHDSVCDNVNVGKFSDGLVSSLSEALSHDNVHDSVKVGKQSEGLVSNRGSPNRMSMSMRK